MWEENPSVAFYKKAQNMCKMHKNWQNSVEFISDIRSHVGMDARNMKKAIQYEALLFYLSHASEYTQEAVSEVTDTDFEKVTEAQLDRFMRVLNQMIEQAESKV